MLSATLDMFKRLGRTFNGYMDSGSRFPPALIGLDMGSQMIKIVRLRQIARGWQLEDVRVRELPKVKEEKTARGQEQSIERLLKDLVNEMRIQGAKAAISLSGPSVMVKTIDVPSMTREELKGHLELEADQYLRMKRRRFIGIITCLIALHINRHHPCGFSLLRPKRKWLINASRWSSRWGFIPSWSTSIAWP